jgi:mono/diheme cytochrome c family protein
MNRTLAALVVLSVPAASMAQPAKDKDRPIPGGKVSYYKDVRPIFQQQCQGCHQPAKPQGGFVMTSYPDLLKPGDSELPGVVPGKPQDSLLVKLLGEVQGRAQMPKGKDPLPQFQVKLVTD